LVNADPNNRGVAWAGAITVATVVCLLQSPFSRGARGTLVTAAKITACKITGKDLFAGKPPIKPPAKPPAPPAP